MSTQQTKIGTMFVIIAIVLAVTLVTATSLVAPAFAKNTAFKECVKLKVDLGIPVKVAIKECAHLK